MTSAHKILQGKRQAAIQTKRRGTGAMFEQTSQDGNWPS